MNRVIIIGPCGAGKSTLAAQLAGVMGCPFVEIDALFWNPGWVQTPTDEFRQRVSNAIAPMRWTAGGNYGRARDLIWQRADTLVWLDYPLHLTLWRLFRRTVKRVATREELWNGNRETFRSQFMSRDSLFVWSVRTYRVQRIAWARELQQPAYAHLQVLRFHEPRATEEWFHRTDAEQS